VKTSDQVEGVENICVTKGATSNENKSDSVVNTRAFHFPLLLKHAERRMKVAYIYGDGAQYFAVETHRGHISLDLAKQSEHLNFKYGVYISSVKRRPCRSFAHTSLRMTRERIFYELVHERSFFAPSTNSLSLSSKKRFRTVCKKGKSPSECF